MLFVTIAAVASAVTEPTTTATAPTVAAVDALTVPALSVVEAAAPVLVAPVAVKRVGLVIPATNPVAVAAAADPAPRAPAVAIECRVAVGLLENQMGLPQENT